MIRLFTFIATAALALVLASTWASAEKRVALVVSNKNYEHVSALGNTENDALAMSDMLQRIGFDVVTRHDLDNNAFRSALQEFRTRADEADVALIYYAGHGIEVDNVNYLIPTDARLERDTAVEFEAVPLDLVTYASAGAKRFRLVILDACRNNPFLKSMARSVASRSIGRGLAVVEPATTDTLIAYSAREGTVALDGTGTNSPYANALLSNLAVPGVEVGTLFRRVRDDVMKATGGLQEPFVYGSLSSAEFFLHMRIGAPAAPLAAGAAGPAPAADPCRFAETHWKSVEDAKSRRGFEDHLSKFPTCPFAELARIRLEDATKAAPPKAAPKPAVRIRPGAAKPRKPVPTAERARPATRKPVAQAPAPAQPQAPVRKKRGICSGTWPSSSERYDLFCK